MAARTLADAVLRNLQTLTESSQRLTDALKEQHAQVNWRGMAGFRNILVHDYLSVNLKRVWEIIEVDLPGLKTELQPLFQGLPAPPGAGEKKKSTGRSTPRRKTKEQRPGERTKKKRKR